MNSYGSSSGRREQALADLHERLGSAVDALTSSDAWRATLQVAARFHTYSPNNVLLITIQRPGATRVAGYRAWSRLGRQVRRGERGIAILAPVLGRPAHPDAAVDRAPAEPPTAQAPERGRADGENDPAATGRRTIVGFRPTYVFDITQTDGPPLPEIRPQLLDGAVPLRLWAGLLEQVESAGYAFGYGDLTPANGQTNFTARTVQLDGGLGAAQRVKTLAHELAHVRLHAPEKLPAGLDRPRAEVEAESVAYIITAAHGLASEDYTVPYVAHWAGGNHDLLADTATRVLGCARDILQAVPPPPAQPDPATRGMDGPAANRLRHEPLDRATAGWPGRDAAGIPARGAGR